MGIKRILRLRGLIFFLTALVCIFIWIWTDPTAKTGGTVKIYDRNGYLMYEFAGKVGSQQPVAFSEISQSLKDAVVAVEDKRFWLHRGVDLKAIVRAAWQNLQARRIVSGGSTISQQVVRFTAISPQAPVSVNWLRKVREVLMALRLSLTTSREEVLEKYLNVMYFGRETYGVQAASQVYFGKQVSQLSLAQSALLAGMVANPSRYDPFIYPGAARARRNFVLKAMIDQELVNKEAYQRAIEEPLPNEVNKIEILAPHVAQMVMDELDRRGITTNLGLKVYTTIDKGWYELALEISRDQVEKLREKHNLTNAAVVVLENSSGRILALVGSVNYFGQEIEGENNMALALRQPGSAMKPVTYAAAFTDGKGTPATLIYDMPKVFPTRDGEGFLPHNYDGRYRGLVLVREALASSYNMPAVEMLSRVGIAQFLDLAHDMGITSMQQTDRYDLALTLGGGEVNLLELTNLYATFARKGKWLAEYLIERVETDDGTVFFKHQSGELIEVLDEKVAWLVTDILSDKKARIPTFGEKNPLVLAQIVAVKTGTTTDWHDNWTIGYTPEYTVGVWVGNADNSPMRDLTGVTGAAPIWNAVLSEIIRFKGSSVAVQPEGIVEREICAWDGLLPTDACTERLFEVFIQGTEPNEYSQLTSNPAAPFSWEKIAIVSPRQGAVYEIEAYQDERIVFELGPHELIKSVIWQLDGKVLGGDKCGPDRLSCVWEPTVGEHKLLALVTLEGGQSVTTEQVSFTVISYKEGYSLDS